MDIDHLSQKAKYYLSWRCKTSIDYPPPKNPKMVDIGCSVGATVVAAKQLGWQASGVDISQAAVDYCREQGLDCYKIDGPELPFEDNTFDLVTNWHVIEHVKD